MKLALPAFRRFPVEHAPCNTWQPTGQTSGFQSVSCLSYSNPLFSKCCSVILFGMNSNVCIPGKLTTGHNADIQRKSGM